MNVFDTCHEINDFLLEKDETQARDRLIKLLDYHAEEEIPYTPLVNHLIRETGLYPYLQTETASWSDRFIYEAFKVDIGRGEERTLHREQSHLLKRIIDGENVAVSAPTSFGKSFIIDAFIALNRPNNVVIIVPTIALTDETRRRLYKKFSDEYKIITTAEVDLAEKNIFIFPQERALSYIDKLETIDLLIVDEFYKAAESFDKERAPSLIRAIIKLGEKAKQKYFLAPNIKEIKNNPFTEDMNFMEVLGFNTVYLEKHELYRNIGNDEQEKGTALLKILNESGTKTLIYAGTYPDIDRVSTLITTSLEIEQNPLLNGFADWLAQNYDPNWKLTHLVRRGTGIHNGRLHRSLSQIQVKLFEEEQGLKNIVSTSSIIEGVNTSAKNVVIWRNRNGNSKLTDFSYKNIIGRGGRMFQHFIGQIYLLEAPPLEEQTQLEIPFPETLMADVDEEKYKESISKDQIDKIIAFKEEMRTLLGPAFEKMVQDNVFQSSDSELIKKIALDMKNNPDKWNGLAYLHSENPDHWDRLLYKAMELQPSGWDIRWRDFVSFVKILSNNWKYTIPEFLGELAQHDIDIDKFFMLERNVTFKLSALLADINELQKIMLESKTDISPFISKLSHAFLPSVVYQLEEYGLPRMVSKKLHQAGLINFLDPEITIHSTIKAFHSIGIEQLLSVESLDVFDKYILDFFYDGITLNTVTLSEQ